MSPNRKDIAVTFGWLAGWLAGSVREKESDLVRPSVRLTSGEDLFTAHVAAKVAKFFFFSAAAILSFFPPRCVILYVLRVLGPQHSRLSLSLLLFAVRVLSTPSRRRRRRRRRRRLSQQAWFSLFSYVFLSADINYISAVTAHILRYVRTTKHI